MARERRTIKILLLEDHDTLGDVGDVVPVRPGYARNFLVPTGAATMPTPDALRQVERAKLAAVRRRAERAEKIEHAVAALEGMSVTLEERASEEGHLFGSVGAAAIVAALAEKGIEIEEKQVDLETPIKELGIF
ncbi:MAG: 50S ribosomal protein L9, partial [Planctomycetota bacterium]